MANGTVECIHCHTPLPENSRYCFACGADVSGGDAAPATSSVDVLRERLQRLIEGQYEIERLLGKGGMAAVFLAHDLTLEREVAIKVLPPDVAQDEQVVRRFQQEAKTAAKLDHPNIIPIYRVESEGGLNYFVMKYISGTSLEDLLEKRQPLAFDHIQRVLWEAACALGHAHQRGVVHRDVKPANIMFDHHGRVMLTDFGISKALQAATGFTATGMIIGTPHYMAPEQAKGAPVDGRADQYSLGVVGYRMITAELPFGGDSVHTIIYKHIYEQPPLASTGPDRFRGGGRGRGSLPDAGTPRERGAGSGALRRHCEDSRHGSCTGAAPARPGEAAANGAGGRAARFSHHCRRPVRRGLHRRRRCRSDAAGRIRREARPPHDPPRARRIQDDHRDRACGREQHSPQALHPAPGVSRMTRHVCAPVLLAGVAAPAAGTAQAGQNRTPGRAQQAYDNLGYRQGVPLARAAPRGRLTGAERARAYELLGFTYGALDSILKAVDAFKQVVLIDPERQLDPNRVSPKAYSAFDVALRQVLLVRQLRIDS